MTTAPRWKAVALALLAATALVPEAAVAEKMAKDMDLKDLPETFWYNEVTGESQWDNPTLEYKDDKGNTYWHDPSLGETVWTKPAAAAWVAVESTDPDHNGQKYYYNEVTKESQWEVPEPLGWKEVPTADSHGAELK